MVEEKRKAMLDDVGELFDESEQWLLKIQVDGHVDGDSETTTETNQRKQKWVSGNLN